MADEKKTAALKAGQSLLDLDQYLASFVPMKRLPQKTEFGNAVAVLRVGDK
jgi:hypothetical protein